MRAVVQKVSQAKVSVEGVVVGQIEKGMVVLLGIGREDSNKDIEYLARKIINLRIFDDADGRMNISLTDIKGSLLIVSQFTLYGDCRKGKRPSYDRAARPEDARGLYDSFVAYTRALGIHVETGIFQAMMDVEIHNEGPVTLLLDSRKEF